MIVLDTNILISALLKDSLTRKIIVSSGFQFCFPEISLEEIRKYKSCIIEKGNYTEKDYHKIIITLLQYVQLIPLEVIEPFLDRAKKIMDHVDYSDTIFIATALCLSASFIWSDDRDYEQQHEVKVLKTKDMFSLFCKNKDI